MANNPYVNKVQYGNKVLIDISNDTVAANKMLSGITAHDKSGASITGNIPIRSNMDITTSYDSAGGYQLVGLEGPSGYYSINIGTWISEVIMQVPQSGSHKFTVYIPNGTTNPTNEGDWIPLEIEVDSNGNSNVVDDTIAASGVSF